MQRHAWERGAEERHALRSRTGPLTAVVVLVALAAVSSCTGSKEHAFEAKAKVLKVVVNRKDAAGNPTVADVDLAFTSCPGEIKKLIRGGEEFAPCVAKLPLGTEVSVKLVTALRRDGHRAARVVEVGGCKRAPDPTDSRSYGTLRVCENTVTDGIVVGFHCETQPTPAVLAACPWLEQ